MKPMSFTEARALYDEYGYSFSFIGRSDNRLSLLSPFGNIHFANMIETREAGHYTFLSAQSLDAFRQWEAAA